MGYIKIVNCDLIRTDIGKNINEIEGLWLGWNWEDNGDGIEPDENSFKWDSDFIDDLVKLAEISVEGRITTRGEGDKYTLFVLDNGEVEEYEGQVIFPDVPTRRHNGDKRIP